MKIKYFTLSLSLFIHSPSWAQVILASDPWCPFTCSGKIGEQGLMTDLAVEALKAEGVETKYMEMPWSRALEEGRKGKIHAIIGALKQDAPDYIFSKNSLAQQESCFYVEKNDAWIFKNIDSLKTRSLSLVKDYTYDENFDQYIASKPKELKLDFTPGVEGTKKLFEKLNLKRVNTIIEDASVASYYIKTNKKEGLFKKAGCFSKSDLFVAFSPKDAKKGKELAEKLDRGIEKLKDKGIYKQIVNRYVP